MHDRAFDDLTRRLGGAGITRRGLFAALGLAGLGAAAGTGPARAQDTATPAAGARPDPFDFERLAFALEFDAERMFRLVADGISYDPYPGLLRGTRGTLWALAGNSADQAVLLADLLRAGLFRVRFAIGPLTEDAAAKLEATLALDAADLATRAARQQLAPEALLIDAGLVEDPGPLPDTDLARLQPFVAIAEKRDQLVRDRLRSSLDALTPALAAAGVALPAAARPALPELERSRHVWLQIAQGPDWVDFDPSIPGAKPGEAFATPEETVDELPADLQHRVRFRVSVETASGGQVVPAEVLVHETTSAALVGKTIAFLHAEPGDLEGAGFAVVQAISGAVVYYPCLAIGNDVIVDRQVTIGSGGGALDALGDGSIDGDTIAEWLTIEVESPGKSAASARRVVFDRVDPSQRASGQIDLQTVPQVDLIDVPGGRSIYAPFLQLLTLAAASGPMPVEALIAGPGRDDPISLIATLPAAFHLAHDDLAARLRDATGYRQVVDGPNVFGLVSRLDDPANPGTAVTVETDLLIRSAALLPLAGTTPAAPPGLVAGALAHAVERVLVDPAAFAGAQPGGGLTPRIGPSVGAVFDEAVRQGIAPLVLLPPAGAVRIATLGVSERAKQGIRTALTAGNVVVVPERAVDLGDGPVTGWWLVDPRTGTVFDQFEDGRGATLVEYAQRVAEFVYGPLEKFRTLGCAVAFAAMAAAVLAAVGSGVQLKEAQNAGSPTLGALLSFEGNLGAATAGLLGPLVGCRP